MAETEDSGAKLQELIPKATFIEDVGAFLGAASVDDALNELRGSHQKYKYIEQEIVQRKQRLTFKQPEIAKCLASVKMLAARSAEGKDTVLDFALSEQVFAKARLSGVEAVNLWLGAGVMLEYSLEDAQALLETQLAGCTRQLNTIQEEHDYIRDQITTTEVSMARVYNYGVSQRRTAAAAGQPTAA